MTGPRSPLAGKRILLTRAPAESSRTAELLRARGAVPVVIPMITLSLPKDWNFAVAAMSRVATCDWVVFTSASGVAFTDRALREAGLDVGVFGEAKIAAIGSVTAEVLQATLGVCADLVPASARGEGLAAEIVAALGKKSVRVMILRAAVARDVLPDALRAAGCDVEIVPMYQAQGPDPAAIARVRSELGRAILDVVTFTSGSTVDNLCDALGESAGALLAKAFVASIGPVTTDACVRRHVRVDLTAKAALVTQMIEDLEEAFRQ